LLFIKTQLTYGLYVQRVMAWNALHEKDSVALDFERALRIDSADISGIDATSKYGYG